MALERHDQKVQPIVARVKISTIDMITITDFLGEDHQRFDALFNQLELSISGRHWDCADDDLQRFEHAIERHIAMEETVLFPIFENETTSGSNPTSMMRAEHQNIRGVVGRMATAIARQDAIDFFDRADTMRIIMHQHKVKEETILYPMSDRIFSGRQQEIISAMAEAADSECVDQRRAGASKSGEPLQDVH